MSGATRFVRRLAKQRLALLAFGFLGVVVAVAALAPAVAPHDPLDQDLRAVLQAPSGDNWLGTDELGRDVLSRLVHASRVSLLASALAVGAAVAIGVPIGLVAGYHGGWWDRIFMRLIDAIMALPGLILAVAIIAVLGNDLTNAMLALGIVFSPVFARLTRGAVLAVREEQFVDAARVSCSTDRRIVQRHVLPNVAAPIIIQIALMLGVALLAEAALSFIGLGVQPPDASWGRMLEQSPQYMSRQPFVMFPPGIAIALCVISLNILGDGLRDSLGRGAGGGQLGARAGRRAVDRPVVANLAVAANEEPARHALEIDELAVTITDRSGRSTTIIDDVTFHVDRGEVVGLVGESGCGKSMTGLAVMGLLPPGGAISSGRIRLGGTELVGLSERALNARRGTEMAMVFQEPTASLDPAFTIGDQIGESLRHHLRMGRRAARARAVELLDLVGIAAPVRRVDQYPYELSGGMAQRAMLAIALACDPTLLIADEPTTALDVTIQAQLLDLLRDLQDELDLAVVFITHDLGIVADLCDRAVVMYAGQVVETAATEQLFGNPEHPYTAALLESMPQHAGGIGRLASIPGQVPAPGAWPNGCRFHDRCSHAVAACAEIPPAAGTVRCSRHGELVLVR